MCCIRRLKNYLVRMKLKGYCLIPVFCFLFSFFSIAQGKKQFVIKSPDNQTYFELSANKQGSLQYRVLYSGQEVVSWSSLGICLKGVAMGGRFQIKTNDLKSVNEKFAWPLGEKDTVFNIYNELILKCVSGKIFFNVIVRVFDESVAFRHEIPKQSKDLSIQIVHENTVFQLTEPSVIYQYNQESVFTPLQVDSLPKTCDFPATIRNSEFYISIGEFENTGYTKAELIKGKNPHSLAIDFVRDSVVKAFDPFQTPWRTISFSRNAIGLHKFSDLYLRLTQTSVEEIPRWIKPGKLIRSSLNTQSGEDCIDFAVKHNFQYVMFDAGWYGAEFRSSSDPTQVISQIDMPKIIQYAKDRGIGIVLYVNYVGLRAKLDTILPLYKKWGVKGLKFGFVDGLTQNGILWLNSAIQKVNDFGFILNIHDNYKPTGLSRKYPALLTQEGVRGDENSPDAFHTIVLPFTRFLAGPADFTFCFPNLKESFSKNLKVSKAQQLALSVIYFSPIQSIFWYGKPKDYINEEEIEFFNYLPTVWNESYYLAGDIGKNISVARRHGDTWFIGNAAGFENWVDNLNLNFLSDKKEYKATLYEDENMGSIHKKTIIVKKGDLLPFNIKAKGGLAIIIRQESGSLNN
jgi:alpha-glucosidase